QGGGPASEQSERLLDADARGGIAQGPAQAVHGCGIVQSAKQSLQRRQRLEINADFLALEQRPDGFGSIAQLLHLDAQRMQRRMVELRVAAPPLHSLLVP